MRKSRRHGRGYSTTAARTAAPRARRVSRRSRRADLVRRRFLLLGAVLLMALAVAGASTFGGRSSGQQPRASVTQRAERSIPFKPAAGRPSLTPARRAVGIDVYAADRPGQLSPVVRGFPSRIYVPNSNSDTVDVIDPARFRVVDHFAVGGLPQHITPSFDLTTLWVDNDHTNELTPLDPVTGRRGAPVRLPTRTTCTSRRTARTRSWSRRRSSAWTSAIRGR